MVPEKSFKKREVNMDEPSAADKVKNLASNGIVKELFFLDTMLTPKIITFVYWLMLAGAIIGGIVAIAQGSILRGILAMLLGLVFVRIWCEIFIVFFKMNEALQDIRKK